FSATLRGSIALRWGKRPALGRNREEVDVARKSMASVINKVVTARSVCYVRQIKYFLQDILTYGF
ncbi:hypothetical protein C7B67_24860, partial [filamentous cyanobacterium Phorm 6]